MRSASRNRLSSQNRYDWDMEKEIHADDIGQAPVRVKGQDPAAYAINTVGFRRFALSDQT